MPLPWHHNPLKISHHFTSEMEQTSVIIKKMKNETSKATNMVLKLKTKFNSLEVKTKEERDEDNLHQSGSR